MTDITRYTPTDLEAQMQTTKTLLEMNHGRVLEYGTDREARAYYRAIDNIENGLDYNWKTNIKFDGEFEKRWLEKSRQSREEGFEAATTTEATHHETTDTESAFTYYNVAVFAFLIGLALGVLLF